MSTEEDRQADAKRDAYYEELERIRPDECCDCCPDRKNGTGVCDDGNSWKLIGIDPAYGADADGRRSVMLREWECQRCGMVVSTIGR